MDNTFTKINDYLHYGYIPSRGGNDESFKRLFSVRKDTPENLDFEDYLNKGITVLTEVFDELVEGKEKETHLIPLSGGLDSRFILAALLERVDPSNIQVTTFGTPGSFDYEIPDLIAKKIKINHTKINCTSLDYSMDNLVAATLEGGSWTSVPDNYINRLAFKTVENAYKWSGFMGGEIAGDYSGLYRKGKNNYTLFANYQKRVKNIKLTHQYYSPESALKRVGDIVNSLNEFELIFYYNRSLAGSKPIVNADHKDIITPFTHPKWVAFISNIPPALRFDSDLFRNILTKMYPMIFKMPCKNNAGLGLHDKNRIRSFLNHSKLKVRYELVKVINSVHFPPVGVNYLYYKEAIKIIPSLNKSIKDACENLERRGVVSWLSPQDILNDHLTGKGDYSEALLILLGLEVNLRAEEILSLRGIKEKKMIL